MARGDFPKPIKAPKPSRVMRADAKGGADNTSQIRSLATPKPKVPNSRDYGKLVPPQGGGGFGPMGSTFGS